MSLENIKEKSIRKPNYCDSASALRYEKDVILAMIFIINPFCLPLEEREQIKIHIVYGLEILQLCRNTTCGICPLKSLIARLPSDSTDIEATIKKLFINLSPVIS